MICTLRSLARAASVVAVAALFVAASLVAAPAMAADRGSAPATVMFVCEHGIAKSVLAASLFNRAATERGLAVRALARSTHPADTMPPVLAERLSEVTGEQIASPAAQVQVEEVDSASVIVVFDVDAPWAARANVRRWDGLPSVQRELAAARAAIGERIEALLRELERGPG
jgi:hypothetical protein